MAPFVAFFSRTGKGESSQETLWARSPLSVVPSRFLTPGGTEKRGKGKRRERESERMRDCVEGCPVVRGVYMSNVSRLFGGTQAKKERLPSKEREEEESGEGGGGREGTGKGMREWKTHQIPFGVLVRDV